MDDLHARHRHRADARHRPHAGQRGPARPGLPRSLHRGLAGLPALSHRRERRAAEERRMGRRDLRHRCRHDPQLARAPCRKARADHRLAFAAARRAWRAAGVDGHGAGGSARPDRPARRRLRLFARRDRLLRSPRQRRAGTDAGAGPQRRRAISFRWRASPTCCSIPAAPIATMARRAPIRTSAWSIGPAAIRSIITRTSTACARRLRKVDTLRRA